MRPRRNPQVPVGMGEADIAYDRSGGMAEGISGIPSAVGGMKKMSLEFAEPAAEQAPQIPPGAGIPPAGMQGAMPPAGMQAPQPQAMPGMEQGQENPLLAGMMGPQQQMPDSSMFSDQDLMSMVGDEFDPMEAQGQEMFDASMQDPMLQQQLLLAAKRGLGGY